MNGGLPSRRSSHSSRQRSPTAAGSGGRALNASIVAGPRQRLDPEQAAAHVVDVVRVAVVRGADRDDRLQRGRPPGGDLERVEAAPGDPEHARAHRCTRAGRRARPCTSTASSCSCGRYSSRRTPSESPLPRRSTRTLRRSRGPRSRRGGSSRRRRCRRPCGRGCTRAAPAPARSRRPRAARSSPPAGSRRTSGSRPGRGRVPGAAARASTSRAAAHTRSRGTASVWARVNTRVSPSYASSAFVTWKASASAERRARHLDADPPVIARDGRAPFRASLGRQGTAFDDRERVQALHADLDPAPERACSSRAGSPDPTSARSDRSQRRA